MFFKKGKIVDRKRLVFDFTIQQFSNEADFQKLVENYPNNCLLLVTQDQKLMITERFSGNNTRYLPTGGTSRDLLTYDSPQVAVHIVTARDIDNS